MNRSEKKLKNSQIRFKMGFSGFKEGVLFLLCPLLIFGFVESSFGESGLTEARRLFQEQKYSKAYQKAIQLNLQDFDPKRQALIHLFRGIISYELGNYETALSQISKGLNLGTRLKDVAYHYQGLSLMELKRLREAKKSFGRVKSSEASKHLKGRALFHQAAVSEKNGNWKEMQRILSSLEKQMRNTEFYPEVLHSLAKLSLQKRKNSESCHWAKKLYRNYPTFPKVAHWGLHWSQNTIDGKSLRCADTLNDRKARLRRLQWAGASEKADEEMKIFEKSKEQPFDKDRVKAEYLINEGYVKVALELLLPYYPKKIEDFSYLMLLAKAASRASEYQMAVGVYTAAANRYRGTRQRTALFRAAFLSYQHQDYDGALKRFLRLKKKHPTSSLTKKSNWLIPWIYYLKGDFVKSHDLFKWALQKRRRRLPSRISSKQLHYWMAMSLSKMGNITQAKTLFSKLAQDDLLGYYAVAAVQRLKELSDGSLRGGDNKVNLLVHENWLPKKNLASRFPAQAAPLDGQKDGEGYFEEWKKLPFMQEYMSLGEDSEILSRMAAPSLRLHLERSQDLSAIGLNNLAKWELYSIELRTKKKENFKTLMFEYHRNQVYHRSSYLGTRYFSELRTDLGLHQGASLWQFVYPRAYEKYVKNYANKFSVPSEFIWSIMKAETNFRADAVSPVGAKGLMQVMYYTGRKVASMLGKNNLNPDDLLKPEVSIQLGSRYLHRLLKKFDGKIPLAAAAYNGGPHRVHAWLTQFGHLSMDEFIEHIPFKETRNYVKRVTRYFTVYNLLYNKNNEASEWLADLVDVYLEGTPPTKETWEVL